MGEYNLPTGCPNKLEKQIIINITTIIMFYFLIIYFLRFNELFKNIKFPFFLIYLFYLFILFLYFLVTRLQSVRPMLLFLGSTNIYIYNSEIHINLIEAT